MGEVLGFFQALIASEPVQYWGAWITLAGAVLVSINLGIPQYNKAIAALEKVAEIKDPDGRIRRWSTKIDRVKASFGALAGASRAGLSALLPIVGVPLMVLVLVTLMSDWFFGAESVILLGERQPGTTQYLVELIFYFLDQLSRGLFFDAFEVFGIRLTVLEASANNQPYLWMLVGFRVIVDLYVAGLIALLVRAFWGVAVNSGRLLSPF